MIVMDASTAILLAKADLLDEFIHQVTGPVVMPTSVKQECCARDSLDAWLIGRAIQEKRIAVKSVAQRGLVEELSRKFALGAGEAAAIALASGRKGALVASDDRRAINACKLLRIPFTTALSVLTRMWEKGALTKKEALAKLEILARFGRYKEEMVAAVRQRLEG